MAYRHLSIYERRAIQDWLPVHKPAVIARKLERSRATVSRELERNAFRDKEGKWYYNAELAHQESKKRKGYLGCGKGFRAFRGKDPFANMNWSAIREKAGIQQHERVRYNEWSKFYFKKKYRYEVTLSLKSELWRSMYRKKEKAKKRIRLLTQFLTDKRRGRERIFLLCWGVGPQAGKDTRSDRYRKLRLRSKKYRKTDRLYKKKQTNFHYQGLWSTEELLRWLEFLYGKKQQEPEKLSEPLPAHQADFSLSFFKNTFTIILQEESENIRGRGMSVGEEMKRNFKNEPVS